MEKRRRVLDAINHRPPDRVPVDFGSSTVCGMHASVNAALREHYGLEKRLVKLFEPYLGLGEIEPDLADAIGIDTALVMPPLCSFGVPAKDWKEWRAPWGQTVLVPGKFETTTDADGNVYAYPMGDLSVPPSGKMPKNGFFFDGIVRQEPLDEDRLDPRDNLQEYTVLADATLADFIANAKRARASGRATVFTVPGTAFGDLGRLPGYALRRPLGIRDAEDWYVTQAANPDHIRKIFALEREIGLANLEKVRQAAGDDLLDVIYLCGTDFGTQIAPICSLESFREIYLDSYKIVCAWIHAHTNWKILKHSCGAIETFIPSFIEMGADILNPVQCSAAGMDPALLKKKYGDHIVFWGGGVDTQKTLPFGTPEEVRREVLERLRIFSPGGGFVYTCIHCVQALTPIRNFLAMIDAIREFNTAGK